MESHSKEVHLELPSSHRVPIGWLKAHACPSICLRTVTEILPQGAATDADLADLIGAVREYRGVVQVTKKQRDSGIWARNMLGVAASKTHNVSDAGTIAQYRRLLELGLPKEDRPFRIANRTLFRLLSKDGDPALLYEYKKDAAKHSGLGEWTRELIGEAATCALAQAGHIMDPRVRGSAHRIATGISQFLRDDLAGDPFVKKGAKWVLHPDARPPTLFSIALIAYMPSFQRERAGLVDRLLRYIGKQPPRKAWGLQFGRKMLPTNILVLGEPQHADSSGRPKDLPFALHWIELLARLGSLEHSRTAQRVLTRLLRDCDQDGIWSPKGLRGFQRSSSKLADFAYPLEIDPKNSEKRKSDVTFRLALIAKHLGWKLEFV